MVAARIVAVSESALAEAAAVIQRGGLVAFPTETVYGLGANALDSAAVLSIYAAKNRPLTDPILAHVASVDGARPLLALSPTQEQLFAAITKRFWPGPVTVLAPASALVPSVTTAGTGVVGVRLPSHPVAKRLIELSKVPIAAPSANRFGHVSPTTAKHVFDDLGDKDVMILDSEGCNFGIESTIVQLLDTNGGLLKLVRRGAVSEAAIREALKEEGLGHVPMEVVHRTASHQGPAQDAPGQLLTHYSPDIDAFVLHRFAAGAGAGSSSSSSSSNSGVNHVSSSGSNGDAASSLVVSELPVSQCVLIDYGGMYSSVIPASRFAAYFDLSASAQPLEAAANVFSVLRSAEKVAAARAVLLPDLRGINDTGTEAAVFDRIFRAASGRFATAEPESGIVRASG